MNLNQYIETVNKRFRSGMSTEHTFRSDLEILIRELVAGVEITNEPSNVTDCGNPDYVITKGKIPVGFIEAKDIGKDLNSKQYKPQFDRYRKALDNLIITDYLWFQFYQNGLLVHEIRIGEVEGVSIVPLTDNFEKFTNLIQDFCTFVGQTIKSPKKLAEMMAAKARLLENILERAITSDEETQEDSSLKAQYQTFKDILIHDLTPQAFSDIYAQTIAYGMFAARLHDKTLADFSRQEAAELIPKTNPLLKNIFAHIAGPTIDERIITTVDNLAEVFRATNVELLLKNFGKSTQTHDPIIHFYETFLAAYDPKLRKARGVWYTPEPVVNFIVRGVDEILKTEFGLKDGLADTSKTKVEVEVQGAIVTKGKNKGKALTETKEVHKVQVLDPATGTGTFLAEVVKFIYHKKFKCMQGAWSGYVEEHLVPRLNGFELLMASYTMAHLKLDMLLTETGYKPVKDKRFNVFLTNSLEEHHPDTGTLFSSWLSNEANEANKVKRDAPVMVVMGNPPYAVSSSNKGAWILELLNDYKRGLNEKKINLDDDYIKFIRYGQYLISKNGEGILAFITNNSFIDGLTHRKMRETLLETFDKIYVVDLHGNSKRNEVDQDGGKDENVFDIMQGVSISFFIKNRTKQKNSLGEIFHKEIYGLRQKKYKLLEDSSIENIQWNSIKYDNENFFFIPKSIKGKDKYKKYIGLSELFINFGNGIGTDRDKLFYSFDRKELSQRFERFFSEDGSKPPFKDEFNVNNSSSYPLLDRRRATSFDDKYILKGLYRPFDKRWIYYDKKLTSRPARTIMCDMEKENIALCVTRQISTGYFRHTFLVDTITDRDPLSVATRERTQVFPLYSYPNKTQENSLWTIEDRNPNFNPIIISEIEDSISLSFSADKIKKNNQFSPLDLFDYIYAILHCPTYRTIYKEFLKIDFPRFPNPNSAEKFWQFVVLGGELRQIHLMKSEILEDYITSYPESGDNAVTRKIVKKDWELYDNEKQLGRIWINDDQYFDKIPLKVWEFYIGGYQPAQKWLKDRSGRTLSFDDILHYQKIIVALSETDRIMQDIDNVDFM